MDSWMPLPMDLEGPISFGGELLLASVSEILFIHDTCEITAMVFTQAVGCALLEFTWQYLTLSSLEAVHKLIGEYVGKIVLGRTIW